MKYLNRTRKFKIEGYFFAILDEIKDKIAPVMLRLEDIDFFVIYSTVEKLEEDMRRVGVEKYRIKQIANGQDLVDSLAEENVRIMCDPYVDPTTDCTRFTEIKTDDFRDN